MNEIDSLVAIVKDLQLSYQAYQKSLKTHSQDLIENQLKFLKLSKNVLSLFKNKSSDLRVKTLKKQAAEIIDLYKTSQNTDQDLSNTEILMSSFEEHPEVYKSPEEIQEKNQEENIKEIELIHKDLQDLNQMFKDLDVIVEDQGQQLNKVLFTAECSERTISRANNDLEKASFWYRESTKKCCLIIVLILVLLSIIFGTLLGLFLSKKI